MTLKTFWKEKFVILEAVWLIQRAWSEVTQRQLNSAWRKLCPSCVQGDGDDVLEIMVGIVTTARDLELEVNEDDIEELLMEHEDDLTTEELQETQRDVSSEKEDDEKGPMPTSAIKDVLKKWENVRTTVLEWYPNHVEVNRAGDLYNDNAINHFRKILKKRKRQSTLERFFNASQTKKPRTD
jgi:hypothetical protein